MRENWVEICISGFALGVLIRSFVPADFFLSLFLFLVATAIFLYGALVSADRHPFYFLLPLMLVAVVAGIARFELSKKPNPILARSVSSIINTEGVVVTEPDARGTVTFLVVRLDSLSSGDAVLELSDRVRIAADPYPEFVYGDRVRVSGKLEKPESFETDSARVFDYPSYLAKDGIYYELFRPKMTLLAHGAGNTLVSLLLRLKSALLSRIELVVPEPESALLSGLLLGEKHSLGDRLTQAFRRSGLVHIIVLSGYNMTIVAYAIMRFVKWFSRFLPRCMPPLAGAIGIVTFTIMAGASATAIRAALMALIGILALLLKREYDIRRALFLAAFVMIMHNPKIVAFDPSFQLSFLATLGLVYVSPILARFLTWVPERFGIREIVGATISTQLSVLPLLVYVSGSASVVSLVTNLLVLPFIPATMFFGFIAAVCAFLSWVLALPFAYISYALLHYEIWIASFFGSLPFASIAVPAAFAWLLIPVYLLLFTLLLRRFRHST